MHRARTDPDVIKMMDTYEVREGKKMWVVNPMSMGSSAKDAGANTRPDICVYVPCKARNSTLNKSSLL